MHVQDELLWAAAWLHLASSPSPSSQSKYMSYISTNGGNFGGEQDDYTISWDDKRVATKVLLSKVRKPARRPAVTPMIRN
jgi:hypothetical protein